ncbi:MAG: DUF423 domain-containing protein [Gammaproteobacteria bacterium]|nr:DUF423 domain-containing protein [Gammaproteobacteria bacterium]
MLSAVALGAFGAHLFEQLLIENGREHVYKTASAYHFYHALGLLVIGAIQSQNTQLKFFRSTIALLFAGVLVFSGSLYLLAVQDIAWAGALTPLGGLMLLMGWSFLLASLLIQGKNER